MQKITYPIIGILLLSIDMALISFSIQENEKSPPTAAVYKPLKEDLHSKFQDKNLIKGKWQRDDANVELHISKLLKNGGLEVKYFNSKFIYVEKAGWTDSSDVLRLFLIYRQDENPGYSLKLNYLAEKDLLIGVYVDGTDSTSHNVTFRRIN